MAKPTHPPGAGFAQEASLPEPQQKPFFLADGGEVAGLLRQRDWSATPLGPPTAWPGALRTAVGLMLDLRFAMFLAWGPERVLLYNDAYAAILGAKHPDALGKPFPEVWAEIWPDVEPLVERAMDGAAVFAEDLPLTVRRRGFDEQTWFTFSYSRLRDEAGAMCGLFCVCTETTGKVRAQDALRESEDRHRHTVELNPQVAWTAFPDGRLDHVSPRWHEWTGSSGLGESWRDALHPEDLDRCALAWQRARITGEPYDVEHRVRLRDGSYAWMRSRAFPRRDEGGRIMRWYGNSENIHARKLAEEQLLESRDRLDIESRALEVLNRVGVQVAAELDLGTLVQRVVDAGRELSGARIGAFFYNVEAEGEERLLLYALSGADAEAFKGMGMPRPTAVFGPTFRGEGAVRSPDITRDPRYGHNKPNHGMPAGHLPVRSYLALPVTSRSGEVLGGLFFGHEKPDVFSERAERLLTGLAAQAAIGIDNARLFAAAQRHSETLEQRVEERTEELRRTQEQLHQAQKMEAVGQLTGGIAHDFNNLLTGVIGSLEMMRTRLAQGRPEAVERYIGPATESARRAAALTHRLLAFARRQPLDPRPVDVDRLVASMADLLRRTLGESIALEWRKAPHPGRCCAIRTSWKAHCSTSLSTPATPCRPAGGCG